MAVKKKALYLKKKKRAGSFRWLLPLAVIVLLAVGGRYFIHSAFFNVKSISVTGCKNVRSAEIIKLSGLKAGENIFQVDLGAAEKRILTQVMVETAAIEKKFPASLVINILERVPLVQLPVSGGILQIDGQGYILAKEKITFDQGLPVITGVKMAAVPAVGKKLDSPQLRVGLMLAADMDRQMKSIIGEINVADPQKIKLYTIQGAEIRVGNAQDLKTKFDRFQQILQEAAKSNRQASIEYIDVSYSDKPVVFYKPKS